MSTITLPQPSPNGKLPSKTAIVTGGSMGLGAGIVRKFIQEGARVLIFDINKPSALSLASILPEGSVAVFEGDVTKEEHWKEALNVCLAEFGGCDVVVNNAGVVHRAEVSC